MMKKPRIEVDFVPGSLDDWQLYVDGVPIGCPRCRELVDDAAGWLDENWEELVRFIRRRAILREDGLEEISHD